MALPWAIYVRQEVLVGDRDRLAGLLVHEMVHVRQWRHHGALGFLRRYARDYLTGRWRGLNHYEAYLAIGFEVEARTIAGY